MHIILTGATGFIGAEVLSQLLSHPAVTSITALTRKPLAPSTLTSNPKVKNIILEDFSTYPSTIISQLSSASACIWTLGTYSTTQSAADARKVNLEYTVAAANAFATHLADNHSHKFNFVYTSGIAAERDPNRTLWFISGMRKMRGEVETQLLTLPAKLGNEARFQTFVARPGAVWRKDAVVMGALMGAAGKGVSIRVDELAAGMIDVAVNGGEKQIWENRELVDRGREVLKAQVTAK